jgi:tetratricopeptide (TPR) repeat protein
MQKSEQLDVKRSLKTAKILLGYGAPAEATQYIEAVRGREGEALPLEELVELLLVEAEAAQAAGDRARVGELLDRILEIKPGDGQALVQRGIHLEEVAKHATDPDGQERLVAKASTSFRLALEKPEVAYQANLRYGQMLVRQRKFVEALPFLKTALELQPSDNLTQYVRRVERPAERQKERQEREANEKAEADARNAAAAAAAAAKAKDASAGKEEGQ